MSRVDVPDRFWADFVDEYWDEQPGRFSGSFSGAFTGEEVFGAAVRHSDAYREGAADRLTLKVDERWPTGPDADEFLPRAEDGSFRNYGERVAGAAARTFMLSLHCLERSAGDLWLKAHDFLCGLATHLGGSPNRLTIGSFASNAPVTPFGVHTDMTSNFTFVLEGRKRVRVWPRESLEQHFPGLGRRARPGLLDYSDHLEDSLVLEGGPGDMLFWPDSWWHIAEGDGTFSATLVLGIDIRPDTEASITPSTLREILEI